MFRNGPALAGSFDEQEQGVQFDACSQGGKCGTVSRIIPNFPGKLDGNQIEQPALQPGYQAGRRHFLQAVGSFEQRVRIEIYRPLIADPKESRRLRADRKSSATPDL